MKRQMIFLILKKARGGYQPFGTARTNAEAEKLILESGVECLRVEVRNPYYTRGGALIRAEDRRSGLEPDPESVYSRPCIDLWENNLIAAGPNRFKVVERPESERAIVNYHESWRTVKERKEAVTHD